MTGRAAPLPRQTAAAAAEAQRLARDITRAAKDLEKKVSDLIHATERLARAETSREADSVTVYTRAGTLARAAVELLGLAGKCAGLCSVRERFDAERGAPGEQAR